SDVCSSDLDYALQLGLRRAVAAVGVGVEALHQLGVAGADLGPGGVVVEVELGQRVAFDLAEPAGGLGPSLGLRAAAAEQVERIAVAAGVAGAELGREAGRLAREAAGLHLPGRSPAGRQLLCDAPLAFL